MTRRNIHRLGWLASAATLAAATQTSAQTVASAEGATSAAEIIVTARKRDERLIDIPVSIQAFTKETIAQAGIDNLQQISERTPGLNFQNLGNSQPGRYNSAVRFRGMDVNISTPSNQTGAFLVDGVLVLGGAQSVGFGDIERIEIIKGPQAAYFGRGTFGGAVNLITRDPSEDLGGQFAGEYSPNFDSYNLSAAIEGGIAPGITARISGSRVNKGAMFTATDGGELGAERTDMLNATVMFKPTETIRIKARATFGWDDDGAASATYVPYGQVGNLPIGTPITVKTQRNPAFATTLRQPYQRGPVPIVPVTSNTEFYTVPATPTLPALDLADVILGNSLGVPDTGTPDLDRFGLRSDWRIYSLTADFELSDTINLALLGGYNSRKTTQIRDGDYTDAFGWALKSFLRLRSYTLEGRLSGDFGKLRLLGGVSYYDQTQDGTIDGGIGVFTSLFGNRDVGRGNIAGNSINTLGFFGSAEYDITDWLMLSAEGRYQIDKVTPRGGVFGLTTTQLPTQTYNNFLPRIILTARPDNNTTLYASYSVGALPGDSNAILATLSETEREQVTALAPDVQDQVDAQLLKSWEVGLKRSFDGGRATIALAAYSMNWSNMLSQANVNITTDAGGTRFLFPVVAGSSRIRGIELEATAQPSDAVQVRGTLGYIDARYRDFSNSGLNSLFGIVGDLYKADGNRLPRSPEFMATAGTTITQPLSADWDVRLLADLLYQGKTYTDETNLAYIADYVLLNGRLSFVKQDSLTLEVYCDNCLDQGGWRTGRRLLDFSLIPNFFNRQGAVVQPQDRREVGVAARVNF
ncbi:MAG: TonB-dependent receptor [Polymorphobacter sp.]|uniref:TonB-dependent receptor n=1 Tax=Polymorphobacter sp. TaxID=1909290 RepID=UPI003A843AEF